MKIYYIGQKGIPAKFGGVERHVEELSAGLAKLGNDVFVYTRPNYTDKNMRTYRGVNLISLPSLSNKYLDAISHTFRACLDLVKRDVDVVHVHSIGPASLIWLIKLLKPNTPVVFTFHCQDYYHKKWGVLARLYLRIGEMIGARVSDWVITVSHGLEKYAANKYGIMPIYLPNGVSMPVKTNDRTIKKLWELEKNGYILVVSRLIRHKGIHYLIDAYNQLKTSKKLVIVGDGAFTDDYVWQLHNMSAGNPNIIFTGNQTGIVLSSLFSNAYLFVQPSENEGLSIALLEAMSYGKPVLVSDIPENLEAMGNIGYTFATKNVRDLANKLKYLLRRPATIAKLGQSGVERVKKEYDWKKICAGAEIVYEEAMIAKRATAGRLVRRLAGFLF